MRRAVRVAAVLAILVAAAPARAQGDPTCQPQAGWAPGQQVLANEVVDLVNAHRRSIGVAELGISRALTRSALWKSRHMVRYAYFDHDDPAPPVQRTVQQRAGACGYGSGVGENIAQGYATPAAVMQGWLNSPGHRANIENPDYRVIGVGAAGIGSAVTWTQNFGLQNDAGNAPPAAAGDAMAMLEDGSAARIGALDNDTDEDHAWAQITAVTPTANGRASVVEDGRAVAYSPVGNFNGSDTVAYTIVDLVGEAASAAISIGVAPVNDAPVAADDEARVRRRTPRVLKLNVLANDVDVDGDTLKVTITRRPRHGSARVRDDGTIVYRAARRTRARRDALRYRVSDGRGGAAVATVRLRLR